MSCVLRASWFYEPCDLTNSTSLLVLHCWDTCDLTTIPALLFTFLPDLHFTSHAFYLSCNFSKLESWRALRVYKCCAFTNLASFRLSRFYEFASSTNLKVLRLNKFYKFSSSTNLKMLRICKFYKSTRTSCTFYIVEIWWMGIVRKDNFYFLHKKIPQSNQDSQRLY